MRWLSLAVPLAVLIPSPVQASCSGGTFATCASVIVTTRYDPHAGATRVDFIIRNLGRPDDAAITFLAVSNVVGGKQLRGGDPAGPNGSSFLDYTALGPVGHAAGCDPSRGQGSSNPCDPLDAAWDTWCDPSVNPVCWPDEYEMFPFILGCTVGDPFQFGGEGIQTCDESGFTGSAVFSFSFVGRWERRDLAIHANNGDVCGIRPSGLGADLTPCPGPPTIVPEPATWTLMGIGLVGLGVRAWRLERRRRRS